MYITTTIIQLWIELCTIPIKNGDGDGEFSLWPLRSHSGSRSAVLVSGKEDPGRHPQQAAEDKGS